jgi:PAS domain S-box-containing protein
LKNINDSLAIVDDLGSGVLIAVKGKPVYANQALATMFGYAGPDDILNLASYFDMVAVYERARILGYAAARSKGEAPPVVYEFDGIRADGSLIQLLNQPVVVSWQGEEATLATVFDISKRKQAEAALKLSEARLDLLVRTQSDIVSLFSGDGELAYANNAYADFIGVDLDQLVGTSIYDYVGDDEKQKLRESLALLVPEQPFNTNENSNISRTGEKRLFEWKNQRISTTTVTFSKFI